MRGGFVTAERLVPVLRDDAGRVIIRPFADVSNADPWVRLDPLIDVLRKLPDGTTGSPYAWWDHWENPMQGGGPWEFGLDVPLDWEWAAPRAVLPDDVVYEPPPAGKGFGLIRGTTDYCSIDSAWDPDGPTWRRSTWRQGQPYDGPRPAPRPHWWSS